VPKSRQLSISYVALRPLGDNSGDDQARLRHPPTVPARPFLCPETRHGQRHDHHPAVIIKVFLCLETAHSHVLKLDTSERAQVTGP